MRVGALVPVDLQGIEALLGCPHVIADHGDHVVQHDDLPYARDFFAAVSSTFRTLPPCTGQAATVANFMPSSIVSIPVDRLAIDLVRRVEAF